MVLCGGFSEIAVTDDGVVAAAAFAAAELASLHGAIASHAIESAASQVVAGVNYLIELSATYESGDVKKHTVKVHRPLPHTGDPMKIMESN